MTEKIIFLIFFASLLWEGRPDVFEPLKEGFNDLCNAVKSNTPGGIMVSRNNVKCDLYTKKNRESYREVRFSNPEELATEATLCFVIHGWLEDSKRPYYIELKNVLLEKEHCESVCILDWSKPAAFQFYTISANNTEYVGRYVAEVIKYLIREHSMSPQDFKIFGHSLGGHVAGFTGQKFQEMTGDELPLVVAMDPAGPCFKDQPEDNRLDENDATIVIVIHTNGGYLGYKPSCGTIDYFPNCGSKQPGCATEICHHQRSVHLLTDAIDQEGEGFEASQCDSCNKYKECECEGNTKSKMGDLQSEERGDFYLKTKGTKPYGTKQDCSEN